MKVVEWKAQRAGSGPVDVFIVLVNDISAWSRIADDLVGSETEAGNMTVNTAYVWVFNSAWLIGDLYMLDSMLITELSIFGLWLLSFAVFKLKQCELCLSLKLNLFLHPYFHLSMLSFFFPYEMLLIWFVVLKNALETDSIYNSDVLFYLRRKSGEVAGVITGVLVHTITRNELETLHLFQNQLNM